MKKKKLTYKVQRGDDYTKIADKLYGDKRYHTTLKRQNPHIKKVAPGVVIDLLDDDPKEMWKKRERGRRRKTNLMRLDWENVKKKYGINPDLSDIEPITFTIQPQQPPPPEEPTPWWEDPDFQTGLIGLVESTAQDMGLDSNVMLDELGFGEGSPLLAETPTTGWTQSRTEKGNLHSSRTSSGQKAQSQTGSSPSSTTTMTDEQIEDLKKELGEMGLDADVAMYELGLSDLDPYAWETPQVPSQSSGTTGGKKQNDVKSISGNKVLKLILPEVPTQTSLTDEQIAKLKEDLEKMGLDVEAAMYELGLSDYDPYTRDTSAEPSPPSIDPIISNLNQTYNFEMTKTFDDQELRLIAETVNLFADYFGGPEAFKDYTGVNQFGRLSTVNSEDMAWYNMSTNKAGYINVAPNLLTGTSWECCLEPLKITHKSVGYSEEVWEQLLALNGGSPEKAQEVIYKWMVGHEIAENLVANFDRKNIDIVEEFKNRYSGKDNAITERVDEKTEYDTFRQIFCDALSAYLFFPELTSDYDRFFDYNLPALLSQFPEPTSTP